MKQKKSKTGIIIVVILLALLAAAAWLYRSGWISIPLPEKRNEAAAIDESKLKTVYTGTIRLTTEGNGTIEPENKKTEAADYTVEISHVEVENGDVVKEGDLIAEIDSDSVEDRISEIEAEIEDLNQSIKDMSKGGSQTIASPVPGRVKRIFVKEDDVLGEVSEKSGGLVEISADKKLKVEFESANKLKPGSTVTVSFGSFEEEGTVAEKNGDSYVVTIADNSDYQVDTTAEILDSDDNKLGEGILLSNAPYLVDSRYGICDSVNVKVGDSVDSGTTLITRTDYSYNADYTDAVRDREEKKEKLMALRALKKDPAFYAPADGIISEMILKDRQAVQENGAMYTLISTDKYWLKAEIDELDIPGVREGQDVTIVFDAFEDEEYAGKVVKVSALGTNTGGVTTYTVTIEMDGVEKVKIGMSATATIELEKKSDVLLVPVDAVKSENGEKYVTVVSGTDVSEVRVEVGLVNSSEAEILSGLTEGQQVIEETKETEDWMLQMMRQNRAAREGQSPFAG